jgi:hypothetical protein
MRVGIMYPYPKFLVLVVSVALVREEGKGMS